MMRDAKHFERPLEFDAFRFVSNPPDERHNSSQRTRAVDASAKWLVWGYGRILWYVVHPLPRQLLDRAHLRDLTALDDFMLSW